MVKFVIVECTICDAPSRAQEGPVAPSRQRREAVPWGTISKVDTDRDALAAKSSHVGTVLNAADDKPAHKK
jgi:hypothetical protein